MEDKTPKCLMFLMHFYCLYSESVYSYIPPNLLIFLLVGSWFV